jgi:hypothetical protein
VIDALTEMFNVYITQYRGVLRVRQISIPTGEWTRRFDIHSVVADSFSNDRSLLPKSEVTIEYKINRTPLSFVAGDVRDSKSQEDVDWLLGKKIFKVTEINEGVVDRFVSAGPLYDKEAGKETKRSPLVLAEDAARETKRKAELFSKVRRFYSVRTEIDFGLMIGDEVLLEINADGFREGATSVIDEIRSFAISALKGDQCPLSDETIDEIYRK